MPSSLDVESRVSRNRVTSARRRFVALAGCLCLGLWGMACSSVPVADPGGVPIADEPAPAQPPCDNDRLTDFDELLILAPHPDDEILGFGGLADAFARQGKPVEAWVVTDGDAYCEACALWNTGSMHGTLCDAKTLSNFATPEVDSLAEARRLESTAAARALGLPTPKFLGYPDTGLKAAWRNFEAGDLLKPLRRSDFTGCDECSTCGTGYGGGPETELSAETLTSSLAERLATTGPRTLIATTHWLDFHGDHSSLGKFVRALVEQLEGPRTVAYAVIHAHTANGAANADCWYPEPLSSSCPCHLDPRVDDQPGWLTALRAERFQPSRPQTLPDDADYGDPLQLCLPPDLYEGPQAKKLLAIESFGSQLGTVGRVEGVLPEHRKGQMDCSGYLIAFVRTTEVFVLEATGREKAGS